MLPLDWLVERLPGSFKLKDGRAFGLGNVSADDLPECDDSRKNEMRYIPGAAGTADRWVVCEKDAADAYAWEEKGAAYLATLGGGTALEVYDGASLVDATVAKLTFDATGFTVTEPVEDEAAIALNYGTGAGQPSEGDHTHLLAAGATDVTASAAEVNILDGATLTVTELNYVDGVTSAIQTQIDGKQPLDADLTDIAAIADVQGDMITRGAAGWERLGIGTADQVLTVNAGATAPEWAAASGGGGAALVLIAEEPFSGVTSFSLPDGTFTSTYENYRIEVLITAVSVSSAHIHMRLRAAGVDASGASDYSWATTQVNTTPATATAGSASTSLFRIHDNSGTLARANIALTLYQPALAAATTLHGLSVRPTLVAQMVSGAHAPTTAYDAATILTSSGTMTGEVRVYGYQNSPGDPGPSGYSDEDARDAIGAALVGDTGLTVTVDDALDTITLDLDADLSTLATNITAFGHSLVDDANAAAARTTLELVAGGTGDIWVEKAGDTMTGDLIVPDEAYGAGWNGSLEVPTKNAVYDKIETLGGGGSNQIDFTIGPFFINDKVGSSTQELALAYFNTATALNMGTTGASSENDLKMPAAGRVVAMFLNTDTARTAGTAIGKVRINNVDTSFASDACVLNGTDTIRASALDTTGLAFASGDRIGMSVTSASWTPTTANMTGFLVVRLD